MTENRQRRLPAAEPLRIAFIEPYFGGSHRAFAEGYTAASRHDVSLFTHPASFWKWRMQGGFMTLGRRFSSAVERDGPFDLVIGSSMLDLGRFLGEARAEVAGAPAVLYMHENQLTYPTAPGDEFDMTYAMTNWASAAAADLVLFNSEFHMREWFEALPAFLRRLPDERHGAHIAEGEKRSEVMPVGVDLARFAGVPRVIDARPLVLWNHRWEHDKGPDVFAGAVSNLAAAGIGFDIAVAGERFISDPTEFTELRDLLGDRIVHYGWADEAAYVDLLRRADVVVSTARQEFFGISITEAVYAGAFPLLPDALVYPERIPERFHDRVLYEGPGELVEKLKWALANRPAAAEIAQALQPEMATHDWSVVAPRLDGRLEELVREGR